MVESLPSTVALHSRPRAKFVGPKFQSLLVHLGIQPVPSTVKNPQSNAICERLHATVGDMLRAMLNREPLNNVHTALELIDAILSSVQFATRAAVHTTLGVLPRTRFSTGHGVAHSVNCQL